MLEFLKNPLISILLAMSFSLNSKDFYMKFHQLTAGGNIIQKYFFKKKPEYQMENLFFFKFSLRLLCHKTLYILPESKLNGSTKAFIVSSNSFFSGAMTTDLIYSASQKSQIVC